MTEQTITTDAIGPTITIQTDAPAFDPQARARELAIMRVPVGAGIARQRSVVDGAGVEDEPGPDEHREPRQPAACPVHGGIHGRGRSSTWISGSATSMSAPTMRNG